jgi:hypothetical protein
MNYLTRNQIHVAAPVRSEEEQGIMSEEKKVKQEFQYRVTVKFQLDGGGLPEEEPTGKVYLSGFYELSRDGQNAFKNTLDAFFEQVTLIVVDLAQKLSRTTMKDS